MPQFVIRLVSRVVLTVYVAPHFHWTQDVFRAQPFPTHTEAEQYAQSLGFKREEVRIDRVWS